MDDRPPPFQQATLLLDSGAGSTTRARRFTDAFLARSHPPLPDRTAQDAVLAVSELVSNAARHAPGPCTLQLSRQGHRLTIAVTDTSTVAPLTRPGDLTTGTGGFGMHLLRHLARVTVCTHADGKTITACLPPS
jgi:anti-sigma regulatory factor (Ser/Thr protein kinase)